MTTDTKLAFVEGFPITESELNDLGHATWRIYHAIADDLYEAVRHETPREIIRGDDITEICLDADRLLLTADRKDLWELYKAARAICNPHELTRLITAAAGLTNEEI